MVYTNCTIRLIFNFWCKLYKIKLIHVTFPICFRDFDTEGVIEHLNFMHKKTLRMHNLEKLFAARKNKLNEYAVVSNVKSKTIL